MTIEVTTENYEDVLASKSITLLDFWAPWCGPCKMLVPVVEGLGKEYEGKDINIGKINVDEYGPLAQSFGIRNVPTVIFLNNKKEELKRFVGYKSKEDISQIINDLLSSL